MRNDGIEVVSASNALNGPMVTCLLMAVDEPFSLFGHRDVQR